MAEITGEMASVLKAAGLPCNVSLLQAVDPYTIIDLAAAVESGDEDAIAYQLGWIDSLITQQMILDYVDVERPDTSDFGQIIDSGEYRSLYTREWTVYESGNIWRYVIRHEHAGDNPHGIHVEWFVFSHTI